MVAEVVGAVVCLFYASRKASEAKAAAQNTEAESAK